MLNDGRPVIDRVDLPTAITKVGWIRIDALISMLDGDKDCQIQAPSIVLPKSTDRRAREFCPTPVVQAARTLKELRTLNLNI